MSGRGASWIRQNILGFIAIFLAITGIGVAAGLKKNAVKSKQIKDGAVVSVDVGDDSLTGQDIAEGTLSLPPSPSALPPNGPAGGDLTGTFPNPQIGTNAVGADEVADGSLTGADIDESTLSGVDAARVGGAEPCRTDGTLTLTTSQFPPSNPDEVICTAGPIEVSALCGAGGSQASGQVTFTNLSADDSFYLDDRPVVDGDFDTGEQITVSTGTTGTGLTLTRVEFHVGSPATDTQLAGQFVITAKHGGLPFTATCQVSVVAFS